MSSFNPLILPNAIALTHPGWTPTSLSDPDETEWLADESASRAGISAEDIAAVNRSLNALITALNLAGYLVKNWVILRDGDAPAQVLWVDQRGLRVWVSELSSDAFESEFGGVWPVLAHGSAAKFAVALFVQRRGRFPGQCDDHGTTLAMRIESPPVSHELSGEGGTLFSESGSGWLFLGAESAESVSGWSAAVEAHVVDWVKAIRDTVSAEWLDAAGEGSRDATSVPLPGRGLRHIYDPVYWEFPEAGDLPTSQLQLVWEMLGAGTSVEDFLDLELGLRSETNLIEIDEILELAKSATGGSVGDAKELISLVSSTLDLEGQEIGLRRMLTYTELLAVLHTAGLIDIFATPGPLTPVFDTTHPDLTGFYEADPSSSGRSMLNSHTLLVNHVGSYLQGFLQVRHGSDAERELASFEFETKPGTEPAMTGGELRATIAFVGSTVEGEIVSSEGGEELRVTIIGGTLNPEYVADDFERTSTHPHVASQAAKSEEDPLVGVLRATQRNCLHSLEYAEVERIVAIAVAVLDSSVSEAMKAARLDQSSASTGLMGGVEGETYFLVEIGKFPDGQEQVVREMVIESLITTGIGGSQTAWQAVRALINSRPEYTKNLREFLQISVGSYRYDWELNLGANVNATWQMIDLIQKIAKFAELADFFSPLSISLYPIGSLNVTKDGGETFKYFVGVGGTGVDFGAQVKFSIFSSGWFDSGRDLNAENFRGGIMLLSAGASASFGIGKEWHKGIVIFEADGEPILADATQTPSDVVGAGITLAEAGFVVGWVFLTSDLTLPAALEYRPVPLSSVSADDVSFGFKFDKHEVTSAGRNLLRKFAARNLGLLSSPSTDLVFIGHASSAGDEDYNQDLSERRARAARQVLQELVSPARFHVDEARIVTCGVGEEYANPTDDAKDRRVDIVINGQLALRLLEEEEE